jgi:RNA methyltransferase, TrmH family
MTEPQRITSRDNPLLKRLRLLARDNTAHRKWGQVWLEGDHLCRALLARGGAPSLAVFCESNRDLSLGGYLSSATKKIIVSDTLMREISGLESAAAMGFVVELPPITEVDTTAPTVVLDRVQDAGNVGSILRSASAFGYTQVLALKGTAALWSPKVLRAGMGAHFGLRLMEGVLPPVVATLAVPVLVTSSHQGEWVHRAALPWPCAWVMGHEGQGVSAEILAGDVHAIRIAQPGGEESLNVAAAAAICLHASAAKP